MYLVRQACKTHGLLGQILLILLGTGNFSKFSVPNKNSLIHFAYQWMCKGGVVCRENPDKKVKQIFIMSLSMFREESYFRAAKRTDENGKFNPGKLRKNQVEIYAYCIMPNHFHLLLKAELEALASFMAVISAKYAFYYNYKHNLPESNKSKSVSKCAGI